MASDANVTYDQWMNNFTIALETSRMYKYEDYL